MTERDQLLQSIATTIADYREGEIERPTPDHVNRWVRQLDVSVQVGVLRELNHVLDETYLSKKWVADAMKVFVVAEKLVGPDPSTFWKHTTLLNIQANGHSQEELLPLFGDALQLELGFGIDCCAGGGQGPFVYLDDVLFSGGRVGTDLARWIRDDAPTKATVHLIFFAVHSLGEWQARTRLEKEASHAGKSIDWHFWSGFTIENRKAYRNRSEVLWPVAVPDDAGLKAYMDADTRFPFEARTAGGHCEHGIFSAEPGRQLLETEFLMKGMFIRSICQNPSPAMRPLGFGAFGLGFGSTIVTFRNCPNNAPLALWWGDADYSEGHPFSKWYPLLPRKTYQQTPNVDFDLDDLFE